MKTIHHVFEIAALPEKVFAALTSTEGLSGWWTTQVQAEAAVGAVVDFTFGGDFNPDMRITELEPPALLCWECVGGHEPWAENSFRFEVDRKDGGTLLRFWQNYARELSDDAYGTYNFNWGYYLESLRLFAETGVGKPFQAPGEDGNSARGGDNGTVAELVSIAKATAKSGQASELERELLAAVAPTRAQPGNLEFSLHRSVGDPAIIVALERWESRADWQRHLQGPHVKSLMAAFAEILLGPPDIQLFTPVPEHDAGEGNNQ